MIVVSNTTPLIGLATIHRFELLEELFGKSPRIVYIGASKPRLIEGFTKNTFTAMIEGIRGSLY